jgi:hypothetical protein
MLCDAAAAGLLLLWGTAKVQALDGCIVAGSGAAAGS